MALQPSPASGNADRMAVRRLIAARPGGRRRGPSSAGLARRRAMVIAAKFVLPVVALALLSLLALWPEMEEIENGARAAARVAGEITAAELTDARYHSVDNFNRPYTLSATVAQQDGPERINLTLPKGDITLSNGSWVMVTAKKGVFIQHRNLLDLSRDVTLYRDDGITLVTDSASFDLNQGAGVGSASVHAEGPFGTLDAQGFTLTDKGANIAFGGPAKLVLNGSQPGKAP